MLIILGDVMNLDSYVREIIFVCIVLIAMTSPAYSTNNTGISCNPTRGDLDCRKLNGLITIETPQCIGQIKHYNGGEEIFRAMDQIINEETNENKGIPGALKSAKIMLLGAPYTKYIQKSYYAEYTCNQQGKCVIKKAITDKGEYVERCGFGCIPQLYYAEKNYSNVCVNKVCGEGMLADPGFYCDPTMGNNVYIKHQLWWCDTEVRPAVICGEGAKCGNGSRGISCYGIGTTTTSYNPSTQYTLILPHNINQTITVAAIQNGKVIASKPISNLSAAEYIAKNGPLHQSQATYFAQATGLTTTIANTQKTITPSNTSITTASYNSYTPRTINTYTYKPNWNSYTNTTRTNTHKPNYYSNYYTRTNTPRTSYTPYTYTTRTTRTHNPNYYSNNYTTRKTYTYTPKTTNTYTPRANYTSRTYTRNTYTPTTNNTKYTYTPKTTYNTYTRTYSYAPRTSYTRTYSHKPKTHTYTRTNTHAYTYKPTTTTTSTTYSRYYKRTYT